MFPDLTRGDFQYIQRQVSSIQYRRGKNDGLDNAKYEEIKLFMQRWGILEPFPLTINSQFVLTQ